jgi:Putative zinc-finger
VTTNVSELTCPLTCDDVEALLPLIADQVLNEQSDPAVFAHLARCPACQESLAAHDLITVALEQSRPTSSLKRPALNFPRHRQHRLPWPVAMAASLAAACGLWLALEHHSSATTLAARDKAQKAQKAQVVPVQTEDGRSVYVVINGEQITVIDPRSLDGQAAAPKDTTVPVKWSR